jgi:hypothetical protein
MGEIMAKGSGGGSQVGMLLVFLALVAGAGGWNYQRNLEVEKQEHRPYRSYSEVELEQLRGAYQVELGQRTARFKSATGNRVRVGGDGLLGSQLEEFQRVQRVSQSTRAITEQVARSQVQLDLVEVEIARRSTEKGYRLHLRRLTTLP